MCPLELYRYLVCKHRDCVWVTGGNCGRATVFNGSEGEREHDVGQAFGDVFLFV